MISKMSEKRVLVIDDEDFIRELVKDFLEMDGVECDAADDEASALKIVADKQFNLILLDRNLGEIKAEDLIARIREVKKNIPIVILTGDPQCDQDYLKKIGADGIIFKPFQVTEFMSNINMYLET
jgi:two-component system, OmpR family, alkaline phosphatase synthesis response regulator PhoP